MRYKEKAPGLVPAVVLWPCKKAVLPWLLRHPGVMGMAAAGLPWCLGTWLGGSGVHLRSQALVGQGYNFTLFIRMILGLGAGGPVDCM